MYKNILILGLTFVPGSRSVEETNGCIDINGRMISPGLHYVPGPDTYTLCICDNASPKSCKAILCTPPQDCKSFRIEKSCCSFECLDDESHDADIGLRLIACAITVVLSISVLILLVHKLRQRKTQEVFISDRSRQIRHDERTLGFITRDYEEIPAAHCHLWKPHTIYYPPHGEAPPPYEEAVGVTETEPSLNLQYSHRTIPLNITSDVPLRPLTSQVRTISTSITPEQPSRLITYTSYIGLSQPYLTVTASGEPTHVKSTYIRPIEINNSVYLKNKLNPEKPSQIHVNSRSSVTPSRNSDAAVSNSLPVVNNTEKTKFVEKCTARPPPSLFCSFITPILEEHEETSTELIDPTLLIEDGEDYRTECENCNPTLAICEEEYISEQETMTLQRPKPCDDDSNNYLRASLTMPTNYKKIRPVLNHHHVTTMRDSWLDVPESTDESSEE